MEIIIFAGPNGAGKTTIVHEYVKAYDIDLDFVYADIIEKKFFQHIDDADERSNAAAEYARKMRENKLEKKESFMFETVISSPQRLDFIKRAKQQGAIIKPVIVLTRNVDINIARNAKRVSQGGHNVPEQRIRERFEVFMKLIPELISISDSCLIYDNSYLPTLVGTKKDNNLTVYGDKNDEWIKDIFTTKLINRGLNIGFAKKTQIRDKITDIFAGRDINKTNMQMKNKFISEKE